MLKRHPDETLDQYHYRLKLMKIVEKGQMKGKMIWNSSKQGTRRVRER